MSWINPVPSAYLSQGFGPSRLTSEGPAYAVARKAHDISPYDGGGDFPGATYYNHFHAAIDLAAVEGTSIYAPQSGTVLDAKWGAPGTWANGGGYFVRVAVNANCMYLLAHCSTLLVIEGEYVRKGQTIARVGHTGVATGNHTHFWVRLGPRPYYDPSAFFYDPELVLPGGAFYGDAAWEPGGEQIPDTGTSNQRITATGDPAPMKFRSSIEDGKVRRLKLKAGKPIRNGASVTDRVLMTAGSTGKVLNVIGHIDKDKLPTSEQPYGDVWLAVVFDGGSMIGYVKGTDINWN